MSRTAYVGTLFLLVILCVFSHANQALAEPYVVGQPSDCCGANFYVDCEARPRGEPACRAGHVFDHNEEDSDIGHFFKCLGVGCLREPTPAQCRPDVPEQQTVECLTNLRSCANQPGDRDRRAR